MYYKFISAQFLFLALVARGDLQESCRGIFSKGGRTRRKDFKLKGGSLDEILSRSS